MRSSRFFRPLFLFNVSDRGILSCGIRSHTSSLKETNGAAWASKLAVDKYEGKNEWKGGTKEEVIAEGEESPRNYAG